MWIFSIHLPKKMFFKSKKILVRTPQWFIFKITSFLPTNMKKKRPQMLLIIGQKFFFFIIANQTKSSCRLLHNDFAWCTCRQHSILSTWHANPLKSTFQVIIVLRICVFVVSIKRSIYIYWQKMHWSYSAFLTFGNNLRDWFFFQFNILNWIK